MIPSLPNYNFAPSPSNYSPTFGGVPGTVAPAPSIYQQASGVIPNLPNLTADTSNVVQNELSGRLSPETINSIKDQSAIFGVSSGMPGSGLSANMGLRNLGLTSEQLQQQGIGDYLKFLSGVGATQTNPATTQDVSMWNATNAAAPNPASAEQYLQGLLQPQTPNGWNSGPTDYFTPAGGTPGVKLPYSSAFAGI